MKRLATSGLTVADVVVNNGLTQAIAHDTVGHRSIWFSRTEAIDQMGVGE